VAVGATSYSKNGKWSSTTYGLRTRAGVALVQSLTGLHQEPLGRYATWSDCLAAFASAAGQPVDKASLRAAISAEYPKAATALDERDREAEAFLDAKAPTTWIINSAVIAAGAWGSYHYEEASTEQLAEALRGTHQSRIGYPQTVEIIEAMTGIRPELSRDLSAMEPGDVAYVVRLRYRVDPATKGQPVAEDFEIGRLTRLS